MTLQNDEQRANAVRFLESSRKMRERMPKQYARFYDQVIADVEADIAEYDASKPPNHE